MLDGMSIAEFAAYHSLTVRSVFRHMAKGACRWPRIRQDQARKAHPEYQTWKNIKQRCLKPGHRQYASYGARGINLAPEWVIDFPAFAAYLDAAIGPRPDRCTLYRIDNDRGYIPGNLRWADTTTQLVNRRMSARNTSGYKNISRVGARWRVYVSRYGVRYLLYVDSLDAAIAARDSYIALNPSERGIA